VKHREYFRPFAPAVLAEKAGEYFDTAVELPHMTMTVDVVEHKRSEIPVATHEDGTARIQTVNREQNPRFYEVLEAFDKLTGTPVIINTSFNDNLEPIVESPDDALKCFYNTGMEVLVMGDFVVVK
ncbi:MAG TPA: carbamoyltransferase C-terminal domain-containing protein, partial [Pyrinomonadaceae bacterium]|nr:carbamoyltransferase C-terminal domain-containing protein [Pyrinomonadaceae bacterium]